MNIEEIRAYALRKPETSEDLKWGEHLCLMVSEKIFLLLSLDEHPTPASFKVDEDEFDNLTKHEGINQAPYFAKRQWVKTNDISLILSSDWKRHIDESYRLVASKLSKKSKESLG